jgi:hypothetical protein
MLQATTLIIWDEFFSNHREIFESAYQLLRNEKVIFLCIGDLRQILPVVYGHITETIQATFTSSQIWSHFKIFHLTINMRLETANATITEDTPDDVIADILAETAYAEALLALGNGQTRKIKWTIHYFV